MPNFIDNQYNGVCIQKPLIYCLNMIVPLQTILAQYVIKFNENKVILDSKGTEPGRHS